uniref:Phototropin-2 n=1 Tax=Solanum tuberosum TaxID=4113 RepID=M1C1U0_SOLTU
MHRIRGQAIPRKKGCSLISLAPPFDPKRLAGSLFSNEWITCLAARLTCNT